MATATFYPSKDTYLQNLFPTSNFGTAHNLGMEITWDGEDKTSWTRTLLGFDISSLGAATINSAKLRLDTSTVLAAAASTLYRCIRAWLEAQGTWNVWSTGNSWTTAGGDYDGTTPTPVGFTSPAGTGWFEILGLLAFATDAIASRSGIVNLLLRLDDETPGANAGCWWQSKETAADPELVIDYTPVAGAAKNYYTGGFANAKRLTRGLGFMSRRSGLLVPNHTLARAA